MWFLKIIIISVIFIGKFYEFKGISSTVTFLYRHMLHPQYICYVKQRKL